MKKLLTALALTTTMVSFPAFADPGCKPGNTLNGFALSDCDERFGAYSWMGATVITPMPYYGSESFAYVPSRSYGFMPYYGSESFAYVPSRSYGLRRGSGPEPVEGGATSLREEVELD